MRDPQVALLEPNCEIILCPICDELIWKHKADPITTRISLPSHPWPTGETTTSAIQMMMEAADEMYLQTVTLPAEEACRSHMGKRHRIRFWLWERFGWDRVLRKWLR